jgi:hypothetical protein
VSSTVRALLIAQGKRVARVSGSSEWLRSLNLQLGSSVPEG